VGEGAGGSANKFPVTVVAARCLDGGGVEWVEAAMSDELIWISRIEVKMRKRQRRGQDRLHTRLVMACDLDAQEVEGPS
jgi:hypothetical protein